MCLMHKEDTYGKILLKQKFKQTSKQNKNFALQLARMLPFDLIEIEDALFELLEEKVLNIVNDYLICDRMVKDAKISIARAKAGNKGGKKTQLKNKNFASTFALAKPQANSENESAIENESKKENGDEKKDPRPIKKIMEWLESEIGGLLDGSIYDNEANCLDCLEKIEKDFPNERAADLLFWWIESALKDDFHKKNMTNFKYIFKNLGKLRLCHEAMEKNNE